MKYYYITIQVDFETPQIMPPLPMSGKSWRSDGYFQTFYCTEQSMEKAKKLVHQYFLQNEENPSTCQIKFDRVTWMRDLKKMEDLTHGYETGLTKEMFSNRNKIGIWYSGEKDYYSKEDYAAAMMDEQFDEDEYWNGYERQCQACDKYGPIDDISLCNECADKFERDLIRQRNWDYSASAFGLSHDLREKLRNDVIRKYGNELELIASSNNNQKKRPTSRHQRKK